MRTILLIAGVVLSANLAAQTVVVTNMCALPDSVLEFSGLETSGNGIWWANNDSGNSAKLFAIDTACHLLRTVEVTNASNIDWEDLAMDNQGNLYVADIGNNSNDRTDLLVLQITASDLQASDNVNC